LMSYAPVI